MVSIPVDKQLYNNIKAKVYKRIPKHSAYRSGIVVKEYKEVFKKKYGNKSPYKGRKDAKKGLSVWFAEKWKNQRGGTGYKKKGDVYRPTKRITKDTPATHKELTASEKKKAMKEKKETGKVKRFKKKKKY